MIWHLRGADVALRFFQKMREEGEFELWTGAMQRAEVVFFMRPAEEVATLLFLSQFKTSVVDGAIVDLAGKLYRRYHPGHGINPNDAILAATTLLNGGTIFCLNTKHYPMPGLNVTKAW